MKNEKGIIYFEGKINLENTEIPEEKQQNYPLYWIHDYSKPPLGIVSLNYLDGTVKGKIINYKVKDLIEAIKLGVISLYPGGIQYREISGPNCSLLIKEISLGPKDLNNEKEEEIKIVEED